MKCSCSQGHFKLKDDSQGKNSFCDIDSDIAAVSCRQAVDISWLSHLHFIFDRTLTTLYTDMQLSRRSDQMISLFWLSTVSSVVGTFSRFFFKLKLPACLESIYFFTVTLCPGMVV